MEPFQSPFPGSRATGETGSLVIVIATWNERMNLPELAGDLWRELPGAQILVVDDSSPDGTGDWVKEEQLRSGQISLLSRARKEGLGAAAIEGLAWAVEHGFPWIATMDADLSHDARDLKRMLDMALDPDTSPDVVLGSRYVEGGRIQQWPWSRRVASRLVNLVVRIGLGMRTRDNTGALRIYRREALARALSAEVQSRSHVYLEEILWRLARNGAKIVEVPVTFCNRKHGRSSLSLRSLTVALRDLARLILFRIRKR